MAALKRGPAVEPGAGVAYPRAVQIVLGLIVAAATIALAIGAITGRVKAQSCCSIGDPERDLRMASPSERVQAPTSD